MELPMRVYGYAVFVGMWALVSLFALGQVSEQLLQSSGPSSVPRLVKFRATLADSAGHPRSGTVGILFAIYSERTGGVCLWQEVQNVKLDDQGRYFVLLGRETRDGIPLEAFSSGESRWLGVQPLGEEERPRVLLTSVPYALKAADADTLGGYPASAFVMANSSTAVQNVATSSQQSTNAAAAAVLPLAASMPSFASSPQMPVSASGTVNTIPKFSTATFIGDSQIKDSAGVVTLQNLEHFVFADRFGGTDIGAQINAAITSLGKTGGTVVTPAGIYNAVTTTVTVRSPNISIVGAGSNATQINYTGAGDFIRMQMPAWSLRAPPQAGKICGLTINGTSSGRSGIHLGDIIGAQLDDLVVNGFTGSAAAGIWFDNVTNFTERIQLTRVWTNRNTKGVRFTNSGGTASQISFGYERILDLRVNVGPHQTGISVEGGALYHSTINAVVNIDRNLSGTAVGIAGLGYQGGPGTAVADNLYDLTAECTQCGGLGLFLSIGAGTVFTGTGIVDAYSMTNSIDPSATVFLYGPFVGGAPSATGLPVYMRSQPLGTNPDAPGAWLNPNFGGGANWLMGFGNNVFWNGAAWQLRGDGVNNGGSAILGSYGDTDLGFYVIPSTGGNNQTVASAKLSQYQVADFSTGGLTLKGNLTVTGSISKGSGSFKIDHPLDPANKYLSHSFVESPDMMNVYSGNITTDKHGFATVVLPAYFEALNRDFRYQLTTIGQFAQAVVAQEVRENRFTIRTDKPFVRVSWQVTGTRHDAFANAHRVPVEELKPATERGQYLHPELFGISEPQVVLAWPKGPATSAREETHRLAKQFLLSTGCP